MRYDDDTYAMTVVYISATVAALFVRHGLWSTRVGRRVRFTNLPQLFGCHRVQTDSSQELNVFCFILVGHKALANALTVPCTRHGNKSCTSTCYVRTMIKRNGQVAPGTK